MVSGDFLMELEVLLQWDCVVLRFPLRYGEDSLWHQWFRVWVWVWVWVQVWVWVWVWVQVLVQVLVWVWCVQHPVGYLMYCNEIAVRLVIPGPSDRGQWDLMMGVGYALILNTLGRVSPRGSVGMLADGVLLGGK